MNLPGWTVIHDKNDIITCRAHLRSQCGELLFLTLQLTGRQMHILQIRSEQGRRDTVGANGPESSLLLSMRVLWMALWLYLGLSYTTEEAIKRWRQMRNLKRCFKVEVNAEKGIFSLHRFGEMCSRKDGGLFVCARPAFKKIQGKSTGKSTCKAPLQFYCEVCIKNKAPWFLCTRDECHYGCICSKQIQCEVCHMSCPVLEEAYVKIDKFAHHPIS